MYGFMEFAPNIPDLYGKATWEYNDTWGSVLCDCLFLYETRKDFDVVAFLFQAAKNALRSVLFMHQREIANDL